MKNEPLILNKRGENESRIITIRIREDLLSKIDSLANDLNYSRNELIARMIEYGIHNIEIK